MQLAPPAIANSAIAGDIAVIGLACTFPGARNASAFWHNIVAGIDCVTEVDPRRWDPAVYYDPDPASGKIYCKRGGYLGNSFAFNPLRHGTMPKAVLGAEPDQFLVLRAAYEALHDAGYIHRPFDAARAAFILGRGNYLGAGLTGLVQRGMITEQTIRLLKTLHPQLSSADISRIREELHASLPPFSSDNAPGLIPNITAGRVANRLNFMGPTYTVDAACASSLIATDHAVRGLLANQFDLALVGGVHIFTDVSFLHVFCAMGALSASSQIRPFDRDCDGTLPGEGVGILVLKRLEDARRDQDRIYAVIKGVGTSSDGKAVSVTAPRLEGEVLALRRAYEISGIDPQTVTLIEAHGTGTPVGDPTELEALERVLGKRRCDVPDCAIGSVKSMIGHAMPAAGAAALIKTALALHHRLLPPTLHCDHPADFFRRGDCRFYVNTHSRPWINGWSDAPRRAGVNAFGFGGINAHVVLEEYAPSASTRTTVSLPSTPENVAPQTAALDLSTPPPCLWDLELFVLQADSRDGLIQTTGDLIEYLRAVGRINLADLAFTLSTQPLQKSYRAVVLAGSRDDLLKKLRRLKDRLSENDCIQIKNADGIYCLHDSPVRGGKIAFLFPGLGAQHIGMLADLCIHFPIVRQCFDNADRAMKKSGIPSLSADIFPLPAVTEDESDAARLRLDAIHRANPAVLAANGAVFLLLEKFGVRPDMMTGHSSGEWVVLPASNMTTLDAFVESMSRLSQVWHELNQNKSVPRMTMLNLGAGRDVVEELALDLGLPIVIANDNCPHQVVAVVHPNAADSILAAALGRGIFAERLPYAHGYHTPEFTYVTGSLRKMFGDLGIQPPKVQLYSCTTARPYPSSRDEIVQLLAETFARPLLFRDTIQRMHADGARIFVEVGPRGNLSAFVDDILRGQPHAAIPLQKFRRPGLVSLQHALAQLVALHLPLDLRPLYENRSVRTLSLDPARDKIADEADEPGAIQVSLCPPSLSLPPDLIQRLTSLALRNAPADQSPPQQLPTDPSPAVPPPAAASDNASAAGTSPASPQDSPPTEAALSQALATPLPARFAEDPQLASAQLSRHFHLMDSFLQVNQEIMTAFFQSAQASNHGERLAPPCSQVQNAQTQPHPLQPDAAPAESPILTPSAHAHAPSTPSPMPMLNVATVVHHDPGQSITILRTVSSSEDLYLADHCFDPYVSEYDPDRERLAIVPLTVSLEMMAETAALFEPRLKVVAARKVQAAKWIEVEAGGPPVHLQISATRLSEFEVRTEIRRYESAGDSQTAPPLAEATFVLAADYPSPPPVRQLAAAAARTPTHTAQQLYSHRRMFHGPRFRGVVGLDAIAPTGLLAKLQVLPRHDLLASTQAPAFIFDPCLLDAAGQLVGYWPVEFCDEGFVLFPIRIEELTCFRPNLRDGETAACILSIDSVAPRQLRATMDLVAPDGALWMRISGWEDWRFYWDRTFYDFWRFPNLGIVSEPLEIRSHTGDSLECRRMSPFGEMGSSIWENLWAHLILSRTELDLYRSMASGPRRTEWIFGRAAAKDAVRMWIRRCFGLALFPADVEIQTTPQGAPVPAGAWAHQIDRLPSLSISHKDKTAVAIAAEFPVGIDLETIQPRESAFEEFAFTPSERLLLADFSDHDRSDWTTRLWCAKEAVGKLLGQGLKGGLHSLRVTALDQATGTLVVAQTSGEVAVQPPEFVVKTLKSGDSIIAVAMEGKPEHAL